MSLFKSLIFKKSKILEKLSLKKKDYYLIVGRLIPDNNSKLIIEGFLKSNSNKTMVIVGDVPYNDDYANSVKKLSSKKSRILILDQLTDPQNVGSIIRSAFAFNFDAVCLLKNNSPIETPSLIKASAGEIDNIQILEIGNLVQEIKILKKQNFFIYGLDGEGKIKIQEIDKTDNRIALIIGAEGKGLRNLTKQSVDGLIKIEINPKCNSLNAANAASVAMYEISKN